MTTRRVSGLALLAFLLSWGLVCFPVRAGAQDIKVTISQFVPSTNGVWRAGANNNSLAVTVQNNDTRPAIFTLVLEYRPVVNGNRGAVTSRVNRPVTIGTRTRAKRVMFNDLGQDNPGRYEYSVRVLPAAGSRNTAPENQSRAAVEIEVPRPDYNIAVTEMRFPEPLRAGQAVEFLVRTDDRGRDSTPYRVRLELVPVNDAGARVEGDRYRNELNVSEDGWHSFPGVALNTAHLYRAEARVVMPAGKVNVARAQDQTLSKRFNVISERANLRRANLRVLSISAHDGKLARGATNRLEVRIENGGNDDIIAARVNLTVRSVSTARSAAAPPSAPGAFSHTYRSGPVSLFGSRERGPTQNTVSIADVRFEEAGTWSVSAEVYGDQPNYYEVNPADNTRTEQINVTEDWSASAYAGASASLSNPRPPVDLNVRAFTNCSVALHMVRADGRPFATAADGSARVRVTANVYRGTRGAARPRPSLVTSLTKFVTIDHSTGPDYTVPFDVHLTLLGNHFMEYEVHGTFADGRPLSSLTSSENERKAHVSFTVVDPNAGAEYYSMLENRGMTFPNGVNLRPDNNRVTVAIKNHGNTRSRTYRVRLFRNDQLVGDIFEGIPEIPVNETREVHFDRVANLMRGRVVLRAEVKATMPGPEPRPELRPAGLALVSEVVLQDGLAAEEIAARQEGSANLNTTRLRRLADGRYEVVVYNFGPNASTRWRVTLAGLQLPGHRQVFTRTQELTAQLGVRAQRTVYFADVPAIEGAHKLTARAESILPTEAVAEVAWNHAWLDVDANGNIRERDNIPAPILVARSIEFLSGPRFNSRDNQVKVRIINRGNAPARTFHIKLNLAQQGQRAVSREVAVEGVQVPGEGLLPGQEWEEVLNNVLLEGDWPIYVFSPEARAVEPAQGRDGQHRNIPSLEIRSEGTVEAAYRLNNAGERERWNHPNTWGETEIKD